MNPISSVGVTGRGEPARDAGAVPTDLAGMFAAIFAATTAAQATPPPVPVVPVALPEGSDAPGAKPCAEGGMPSLTEGSAPVGGTNGTPALPAMMAPGRPRHDRAGLPALGVVPTLEHGVAPQVAKDAAPIPTDVATRPTTEPMPMTTPSQALGEGKLTLPEGMTPMSQPTTATVDPALARMVAATTPNPSPRLDVRGPVTADATRGQVGARDLSATVARDGLRAVAARTDEGKGAATQNGVPSKGKGRTAGKADAGRTEASAPTVAPAEAATPTPVVDKPTPVSAHAALAGVTPHAARIETPAPQVAAAQGPVALPDEKPQTATPSHATVAFATPDGGEGRLRVSMRGDTLRATLHLPDAAAAERIEQDLGGLSHALRAQGFEEARITVDVARSASAERGHDEPSPREQKQSREQQPHTNERQPRRERGASREER
jgi:Flagellar hook-length control protein FliK